MSTTYDFLIFMKRNLKKIPFPRQFNVVHINNNRILELLV